MEKKADISVIVPVYNVEEYLDECLDSLRRQGDISLEVILIDDGSTDSSGRIADRYAEAYPEFKCLHIPNGGIGHARNIGVSYAGGKYIAFADSDDIVSDDTYSRMYRLAEKNSSELTICNVERFDSHNSSISNLHDRFFHDPEEVTHISRQPGLIYDTTAWNKLILRDFYVRCGFSFPEGIYYEDLPVTIPMHILCNKVSVLTDIGYRWRRRDGATKSITQDTATMKHLEDRLTAMRMLDAFFRENVTDRDLIEAKQIKSLGTDLNIFVRNCILVPEEEAVKMLTLINGYIDEAIEPEMFCRIPNGLQKRYQYVRNYDLEKLTETMNRS